MFEVDDTHDPALHSWVATTNVLGNDFPIQNLPHAVFRRRGEEAWRGGIGIGDKVIDLGRLSTVPVADNVTSEALWAASQPHLNHFMGLGAASRTALRRWLSKLLSADSAPMPDRWWRRPRVNFSCRR